MIDDLFSELLAHFRSQFGTRVWKIAAKFINRIVVPLARQDRDGASCIIGPCSRSIPSVTRAPRKAPFSTAEAMAAV